jgi:hypothetical protein
MVQSFDRGELRAPTLFASLLAEQVGRHPLMQEYVEIPP